MKISFAEPKLPVRGFLVFLVGGDGELSAAAKTVDKATTGALSRAVNARGFSGKKGENLTVLAPQGREDLNILLFGSGAAKDLDTLQAQEIGAGI